MNRDTVVGYVWTDYKLTDDGAGGKFMEPQRREPVRIADLFPDVRARLLARKGP